MIRRLTALTATIGLAVAGLTAIAAPTATAAGTCSAYIPSRVSIGQPYRGITIRAGSNCQSAQMDWAAWEAYHPTQGYQTSVLFDYPSFSDTWDLYSWDAPLGRWQWRPAGAYDANSNEIYQYGPYYTDVRLSSYGRVTATRSGSRVVVRTAAARYWGAGEKFVGWAYARGQIQYRTPGTSTWRGLKDVYSNSSGTYSYTYPTSAARYYRVVLYDAANKTIWGSTSPQVYR
ncbi:hypothetical protein EV644_118128 [Kribbella orskensis]|uniref:Uncharacterized protein n=1 Tax=Kribbella orskensis TaxID=2512216 RepID=A0ABY2BE44_9ACTN|nr:MULTISPECIES: hypothetical protein [Kribbella]TCN34878.1 hypothetical protein EV642_119127 [Kribbella sp. VKM Ac-2500]TCO15584.1 hypothetical protein EV644_118128 [Kribbella orskensis]